MADQHPGFSIAQFTSDPPWGNQSNLCITRARSEQLFLDVSIFYLINSYADFQQEFTIDFITHRSLT